MGIENIVAVCVIILTCALAYWSGYRDGSRKVLVKWQQFLEDIVERKDGEEGVK